MSENNTPIAVNYRLKANSVTVERVPITMTTIYQGDTNLAEGIRREEQGRAGEKEVTTTYQIDPNTYELSNPTRSERIITAMQPKIIKVGNKRVVTETIRATDRYVSNEQKDRGYRNLRTRGQDGTKTTTTIFEVDRATGNLSNPRSTETSTPMTQNVYEIGAKPKIVFSKDGNKVVKTTTTYTVDPTNGNVTETSAKETISEDGAKDKVVTETLASPVRFEKDDQRARGEEDVRTEGRTGTKVTTTTYEVNPNTGEVIPTVHEPVITPATETVVKVAAKDKVVTRVLEPKAEYVGDPTRDNGTDNVVTPGTKGSEVVTTTYTVDPKTGKVTENVGEPVVTPAGKTVIKVGTKEKVVTRVLEPKAEYVGDPTRDNGTDNVVTPGTKGSEVVTTTYTVDPKTGKVTENVGEPVVTPAGKTVIKVGTKEKVERIENGEKIIERRTIYDVNPKTGKISTQVTARIIKQIDKTPAVELKVEAETPKVDKNIKGVGPVVQQKVLPNTGTDTTNTAGLGLGVIAVGAAMVKQRRKLGKRKM